VRAREQRETHAAMLASHSPHTHMRPEVVGSLATPKGRESMIRAVGGVGIEAAQ